MNVKDLICKIEKELDIEIDSKEAPYKLVLKSGVVVLLDDAEEEKDRFIMYANIGELTKHSEIKLMKKLLSANYFYRETRGAVFCYHETTDKIIAFRWMSFDNFDLPTFLEESIGFSEFVISWSKRLLDEADSDNLPG